jgi:hypothetical protein
MVSCIVAAPVLNGSRLTTDFQPITDSRLTVLGGERDRDVESIVEEQVKVKSHGKSETVHCEDRKSIVLLEGSQASLACPS